MIKQLVLAIALGGAATATIAAPTRFDFRFEEEGGSATATGYIVLETNLLANPGVNEISLPDPAVLDLSITVANADAGNGTFGLADFCEFIFDTNGGTLNLFQEWVGQPTLGDPWGTTVPERSQSQPNGLTGTSGDFNFITCGGGEKSAGKRYENPNGGPGGAPNGVWWFTLGADGGSANAMRLVSVAPLGPGPAHHAVPATSFWTLSGLLALVGGLGLVVLRQRSAS